MFSSISIRLSLEEIHYGHDFSGAIALTPFHLRLFLVIFPNFHGNIGLGGKFRFVFKTLYLAQSGKAPGGTPLYGLYGDLPLYGV